MIFASAAVAEPVSVSRGRGLGYVFNHRGNCYLILPNHVHEGRSRLSIATSTPRAVGDAEVFKTFGPETDLSIALVTSGLDGRCTDAWTSLPGDLEAVLNKTVDAVLIRVDASGIEQRDPMRITRFDFETITAVVDTSDSGAEIYQGTSGGILKSGDQIIGMAVQSPNTAEARFLRMDEIVARLTRMLDARQAPGPTPDPVAANSCPQGTITLSAVTCSLEPVAPEYGCSNLTTGAGPYVFEAGDASAWLELDLEGDQALSVSALKLSAAPPDGVTTVPQRILVEVSSTEGSTPRWRRFGSADMSPLGTFTMANGAGTFANQIRLTLQSSWDPSLPARLDCVAVD